jgi:rubrerythrin
MFVETLCSRGAGVRLFEQSPPLVRHHPKFIAFVRHRLHHVHTSAGQRDGARFGPVQQKEAKVEITRRDFLQGCAAVSGAAIVLPGLAFGADADAKAATVANLIKASANGALALARCKAFAAKADEEGYKSVSALFRASAEAEKMHLDKYGMALGELGAAVQTAKPPEVKAGTTRENLDTLAKAIEANAAVYAEYSKQAGAAGAKLAQMFIGGTIADEASRAKLYKQAAAGLDSWKEAGREFLVCQVCAFTTMDAKLKTCPVCSAPRSKFTSFK